MIETKDLNFEYSSNQKVLRNINLEIKVGEFVSIMGNNGSGKSTLARILNRLLKKKSGIIITDGLDYDGESNVYDIRAKVGMIFQNPDDQIVSSIVEEDIRFGPQNLNLSNEEIKSRVDNALKAVGMGEYKDSQVDMLSGGQKQKIAIAGILAMNPDYIIFDESTSMIDDKDELMKFVIELNRKHGRTIIFITHDIQEAIKADRLIIMSEGEIVLDDNPENIFCGNMISEHDLNSKSKIPDLPFTTKVINELRRYGIDLPNTLNICELAEFIAKV